MSTRLGGQGRSLSSYRQALASAMSVYLVAPLFGHEAFGAWVSPSRQHTLVASGGSLRGLADGLGSGCGVAGSLSQRPRSLRRDVPTWAPAGQVVPGLRQSTGQDFAGHEATCEPSHCCS